MSLEVVVTRRDGFEYGMQVSEGHTPDILRFGQVVATKGLINDGKLLDLGYFARWDKDVHSKVPCSGCGRTFMSQDAMLLHVAEHASGVRGQAMTGPIVVDE